MKHRRPYRLCGKRMNGKEEVIQERTSVEFASSFIEKFRKKYEKMGFMYLYCYPV